MKFGSYFTNLLGIKCTKAYSNLFTFDISMVHCLKGLLFSRLSINAVLATISMSQTIT